MEFLSRDEIRRIHAFLLQETQSGANPIHHPGLLHEGALDNAVHRHRWGPWHHGHDLAGRAAYLVRGIVQEHPFADGNKRAALGAVRAFLGRHRATLAATEQEVEGFLLQVAQGSVSIAGMTAWLRKRIHYMDAQRKGDPS